MSRGLLIVNRGAQEISLAVIFSCCLAGAYLENKEGLARWLTLRFIW